MELSLVKGCLIILKIYHLTFKIIFKFLGELVNLTRRVDRNWFEGRIGSRKGIFPSSYIEVISEPSESRGILVLGSDSQEILKYVFQNKQVVQIIHLSIPKQHLELIPLECQE